MGAADRALHAMITTAVREATHEDAPLLWRVLALAASMDGGPASVEIAKTDPKLAVYAEGFPRGDDLGLVAVDGAGVALGAAWLRTGEPGEGKVWSHDVPELVIATLPEARGRRVGTTLLEALLARARAQWPEVALSVRDENPAVRLYERLGFVTERAIVNRIGGRSLAMRYTRPRA